MTEPPPGDQWTSQEVLSLRVQCDDLDQTFYPVPGRASVYISKVIRIASTHFADGTSIPFTLTGVFRLTDSVGSFNKTKTWTAKVKTYNKSVIFATQYFLGDDTTTPPPGNQIDAATVGEADGHLQTCNISRLGGSPSTYSVTNSVLATILPASTLLFAVTHSDSSKTSNATGIKDSLNDLKTFAQWKTMIEAGRVMPPYLSVSYICSVSPTMLKFIGTLSSADEGTAGYSDNVALDAIDAQTGDPLTIADHAHVLMNALATGRTLFQSVNDANSLVRTVKLGSDPLDPEYLEMTIDGDSSTRIQYVYLNSAERQSIYPGTFDRWYYIS